MTLARSNPQAEALKPKPYLGSEARSCSQTTPFSGVGLFSLRLFWLPKRYLNLKPRAPEMPQTESKLWHGPWFLQCMCRIYGVWGLGFEVEGLGFSVATVQGVKLEGFEVEGFRVWGVSV